jgi:hypothetical protein
MQKQVDNAIKSSNRLQQKIERIHRSANESKDPKTPSLTPSPTSEKSRKPEKQSTKPTPDDDDKPSAFVTSLVPPTNYTVSLD